MLRRPFLDLSAEAAKIIGSWKLIGDKVEQIPIDMNEDKLISPAGLRTFNRNPASCSMCLMEEQIPF